MTRFEVDRRDAAKLALGAVALPYALEATNAEAATGAALAPGRDQPFDDDWRFHRGEASGAEAPGFDDTGWRGVDLPHDWSIEDIPGGTAPDQIGPFDRHAVGTTASGFTVGGEGWYRKHFRVTTPAGGRVEIVFDGIQQLSDVWINGHPLGSHVHGYTPFSYDLTPHLVGGDNVLAVRARNVGRNSRWYAGSGIYRSVRIDVLSHAARVERWGVAAWTRRILAGRAEIDVTTEVVDAGTGHMLRTRLLGANGRVAAEQTSAASALTRQRLAVPGARLWSPGSPMLYTLETSLLRGGAVIDRIVQPFGVRIIAFDTARGTTVNGVPVRLRGGCVHHDNGLLGAAAFAQADDRRVRLLKARGYNAIRSSHNPASRSFRDACDRHGMLLIEEAFDTWFQPKEPQDYANYFRDDWQRALTAMVRSARNSASVMMWSIGNEVPDRSSAQGVEWEWKLANEVRRLDPTRPVTAALNGVLGAEAIAAPGSGRRGQAGKLDEASALFLDVAGYNYRLDDVIADHARFPDRIIYASETFPKEAWDYRQLADTAPYMLGEFVWTAMDYIGEAGVGATAHVKPPSTFSIVGWPWVIAGCGDVDLIGDQRAPSLMRDVVWGVRPLAMTVQRPVEEGRVEWISPWGWSDELESWTWPEASGKPLNVRVYTMGDRVEVHLNGHMLGSRTMTAALKGRAEFTVPYAPGTLEAVAYRGAREIGRRRLDTVGTPAALRLDAEPGVGSGRQALRYIGVTVLDEKGRTVPDAQIPVALTIDGPAELVGFGSGDPHAIGSFQSAGTRTFHGRALAILRGRGSGTVRVETRSAGLAGSAATISLR